MPRLLLSSIVREPQHEVTRRRLAYLQICSRTLCSSRTRLRKPQFARRRGLCRPALRTPAHPATVRCMASSSADLPAGAFILRHRSASCTGGPQTRSSSPEPSATLATDFGGVDALARSARGRAPTAHHKARTAPRRQVREPAPSPSDNAGRLRASASSRARCSRRGAALARRPGQGPADPRRCGARGLPGIRLQRGGPGGCATRPSATPLVQPKPSWVGYSPPPAGLWRSVTSYFSIILPVSR